jgi:hypothetical protein
MHIRHRFVLIFVVIICASRSDAGGIFQSGALGPTGVLWEDVNSQSVPSTNVDPDVFIGARFYIAAPVITTRIGGHFIGHPFNTSPEFYGAIAALTAADDFPDSIDLTTPDVRGETILSFGNPSSVSFGDLALNLQPGWYALIFGSGLFGTHSYGNAVRDGTDFGVQSYFAWDRNAGVWHELDKSVSNHYVVVEGAFIPEPSSFALALFAAAVLVFARRRRPISFRPLVGPFRRAPRVLDPFSFSFSKPRRTDYENENENESEPGTEVGRAAIPSGRT